MFDSSALREAVTIGAIRSHLEALQTIAYEYCERGYRAAGHEGSEVTLQYISEQLANYGDYFQISTQNFTASYTNRTSNSTETVSSFNLFAETYQGNSHEIVMTGAHYDSVNTGPGINDNGSGTAAILEIAKQMAMNGIVPWKKVRFVFWGAEELGLLGSQYYVQNLVKEEQDEIAIYLNFDMIGSPNFVRAVYHDEDDTSRNQLSSNVEQALLEYFEHIANLPAKTLVSLGGRSDHFPFRDVNISVSGLFTGGGDNKTDEDAALFGGVAGEPHDPCYHQACDNLDNVNLEVLDQMSDAAAHIVLLLAMNDSSLYSTYSPTFEITPGYSVNPIFSPSLPTVTPTNDQTSNPSQPGVDVITTLVPTPTLSLPTRTSTPNLRSDSTPHITSSFGVHCVLFLVLVIRYF
jgi:hypothetical protein